MIQLYDYYRSSASFRVRIALNLKGLDYKIIPVNLLKNEQRAPEYIAINPQALVPALLHNDKVLSQSMAIIEYLEECYPTPTLYPIDALQKAEARSIAYMITADMHPLNNVGVLQFLTNELGLSEEQKNIWYQKWIARGFTALEKKLAIIHNPNDDFCFGNTPTIADICLAPQMFNARRFSCDLSSYPLLVKIDAHCQKHPAFIKAWPTDPSK